MVSRPRLVALACACATAVCALSASAAGAATWSATKTHAVHLANATSLGTLPSSSRVPVAISLRERDTSGLATFIRELNTPGSAEYGHPLTPAQFTAQYAPTAAQVSAVVDYLQGQGFTDVASTSNRLFVTADATAKQAESAFKVSLSRYQQAGRTVYANPDAAQVPASIAGTVVSVLGLNDVSNFTFPMSKKSLSAAPSATNCELNPLSGGEPYGLCYYTPSGFRTAYDTGSLTGSNTAIAIMAEGDLTGVVQDLRTAEAAFDEPQVPYTIEQVGTPSTDTSGADEWDLDTQYSTGMASNVSQLYLYDVTSLDDSDIGLEFNKWASQDLAKAGSASFGECEEMPYEDGLMQAGDEIMNEAAAQGQTMFASSGDTGGQSCAVEDTNGVPESGLPEVNYPCSSPYVVCVGGTSLFTNSDGSYDTELGWYAGGGGVSTFEPSPYWQSCVAPSAAGALRGVPDIAMDADANTGAEVYVDGSPEEVGGTSLSSPLALGSWADIESANGNDLGFASPLLYGLYPSGSCQSGVPAPPTGQLGSSSSDPSYPFHDVDLGSNVAYPATFGWDYVTGLGSFDVAKVAAALGGAS
jgi:pseudomonalisin